MTPSARDVVYSNIGFTSCFHLHERNRRKEQKVNNESCSRVPTLDAAQHTTRTTSHTYPMPWAVIDLTVAGITASTFKQPHMWHMGHVHALPPLLSACAPICVVYLPRLERGANRHSQHTPTHHSGRAMLKACLRWFALHMHCEWCVERERCLSDAAYRDSHHSLVAMRRVACHTPRPALSSCFVLCDIARIC